MSVVLIQRQMALGKCLEIPLGESLTRVRFEVIFEFQGPLLRGKCHVGYEHPRTKFGGMGSYPGIVIFYSLFRIGSKTNEGFFWDDRTSQQVYEILGTVVFHWEPG